MASVEQMLMQLINDFKEIRNDAREIANRISSLEEEIAAINSEFLGSSISEDSSIQSSASPLLQASSVADQSSSLGPASHEDYAPVKVLAVKIIKEPEDIEDQVVNETVSLHNATLDGSVQAFKNVPAPAQDLEFAYLKDVLLSLQQKRFVPALTARGLPIMPSKVHFICIDSPEYRRTHRGFRIVQVH